MSEPTFTPGPWRREECAIVSETAFYEWDEQGLLPIKVVDLRGAMGGNDTDADANLIAAAPDLYEALEALLNTEIAHIGPFAGQRVIAARAALAKARGEA